MCICVKRLYARGRELLQVSSRAYDQPVHTLQPRTQVHFTCLKHTAQPVYHPIHLYLRSDMLGAMVDVRYSKELSLTLRRT